MLFRSYPCNLNVSMALYLFSPIPAFKRRLGDVDQLLLLLLRFHMFAWWKHFTVFSQLPLDQASFLDLSLLLWCFLC